MKPNEKPLSFSQCAKVLGLSYDVVSSVCTVPCYGVKLLQVLTNEHYGCGNLVYGAYPSEVIEALKKKTARWNNSRTPFTISKKIGRGHYEIIAASELVRNERLVRRSMESVVEMEKRLNSGMLAEEAEAAYPRMGMHNHVIYKVSIIPSKTFINMSNKQQPYMRKFINVTPILAHA